MLMRRTSLIISIILHIAVVIVAMTGLPFMPKREFEIPPAPIVVDYVEMSAVTETTKISTKPRPTEPSDKDAPPPMPEKKPKPEKAAKNVSKEISSPSKEEGKSKAGGGDNKGVPLPVKKDDKITKDKNKEEADGGSFSSVLKNLVDQEDEDSFVEEGFNAPLGAKMTISEQDALRAQLEKCWNVPIGARDAENMVVEILIHINPDRTLRDAKIMNNARYNSDNFFRAVADSAMRAVRSPLCSPFQLPIDKYDIWKKTIVRFNARDMF